MWHILAFHLFQINPGHEMDTLHFKVKWGGSKSNEAWSRLHVPLVVYASKCKNLGQPQHFALMERTVEHVGNDQIVFGFLLSFLHFPTKYHNPNPCDPLCHTNNIYLVDAHI